MKKALSSMLWLTRKIIFHFPFVILDFQLKQKRSIQFLPMTNLKLQMENLKFIFLKAIALIALILTTAAQARVEPPVAGAIIGSRYFDPGSQALLMPGFGSDSVASTQREPDDRAGNPRLQRSALIQDADIASAGGHRSCRRGDRGRLIRYEKVASYPTAASVRDYFDEWIAFYQDFYQFPPVAVTFNYGFDSYKLTYCTVDAVLPDQTTARPVSATGMVSVPRKPGPLSTVAYLHGTSVSFYDAVSNPNIFGEFEERGESFDGPPSNSIFAGAGFICIAPDYLGLGDSTVPRHRYFHAETEASSAVDLLTGATDAVFLSRYVERRTAACGGLTRGADRDVEKFALVAALLLGRIRPPGRVEVSFASSRLHEFIKLLTAEAQSTLSQRRDCL